MVVETAFEQFRELQKKIHAYGHACSMLYYDGVTGAPVRSASGRGDTLALFSGITYELHTCDSTKELVAFLIKHKDELTEAQYREVSEFNRSNEYIGSIPKEEYEQYTILTNEADTVWHQAKAENNFAMFEPYLQKIVDFNRRFAGYYKPGMPAYDVLLDQYERGLTMQTVDGFFDTLRARLVPLIAKVTACEQPDDSFLYRHYPLDRQKEFAEYLMQVMGIDRERCGLDETEHPFTINFNKNDVRITTNYKENSVASSMYSVIHEGGHAIYELGSGDEYENTCLAGGVSMGIHESQSRLFENIIGRSRAFCRLIFPKMQELFPEQLESVDAEMMYRAVNRCQPSLIRTEADEVTYALHVMVRYEIEKALIAGELTAKELPQVWNAKYKEYLGVDVPNDREGVLQDSHWSGGSIGYFPSYALGSAYGAQMIAKMRETIDVETCIEKGDLSPIVEWLTERIYRHGCRYDPSQILENCVGAKFDPNYFVDYLEAKMKDIYNF